MGRSLPKEQSSCNALPQCLRQWAVQLLQCTASLPWGGGNRNPCNILPHSLWAVGNGTRAMHCHSAWRKWAVELLPCTASPPGGNDTLIFKYVTPLEHAYEDAHERNVHNRHDPRLETVIVDTEAYLPIVEAVRFAFQSPLPEGQ